MNHINLKNKKIFSSCDLMQDSNLLQNWIELSQSALESNALQFKRWLGPITKISGVVKSNAYGHGLLPIAELYQQCTNIASLSVINLSEALLLRQHGITKEILVIGYLDAPYEFIVQYAIQVVVYDYTIIEKLNETGKKYNQKIAVHIKFDTGMSRLGIVASELEAFIKRINLLPFLQLKGIFSHFSESYNIATTHQQESIFALAQERGLETHISNSHGSLTTKYKNYSFARIGIGLYGYLQRHDHTIQQLLQPILSLKTRILQIKQVTAGTFVGYDSTYQASTDMTIAILAIGYTEGLDARLSNIGSVIINGQFAPILGRVCMNLTIVDISAIEHCSVNQIVTVLGKEGNVSITAYDWSALTGTSAYNHLTKISNFVPKIIVD